MRRNEKEPEVSTWLWAWALSMTAVSAYLAWILGSRMMAH